MVKRYKIRDINQPLDGATLAAVYENVEVVLGSDYAVLEARLREREEYTAKLEERTDKALTEHAAGCIRDQERIAELEAALAIVTKDRDTLLAMAGTTIEAVAARIRSAPEPAPEFNTLIRSIDAALTPMETKGEQ